MRDRRLHDRLARDGFTDVGFVDATTIAKGNRERAINAWMPQAFRPALSGYELPRRVRCELHRCAVLYKCAAWARRVMA
jgi:hypothetical protein